MKYPVKLISLMAILAVISYPMILSSQAILTPEERDGAFSSVTYFRSLSSDIKNPSATSVGEVSIAGILLKGKLSIEASIAHRLVQSGGGSIAGSPIAGSPVAIEGEYLLLPKTSEKLFNIGLGTRINLGDYSDFNFIVPKCTFYYGNGNRPGMPVLSYSFSTPLNDFDFYDSSLVAISMRLGSRLVLGTSYTTSGNYFGISIGTLFI